ncbi:MAG: NAD(P)-dependent oxidoreductase [Cyanobacteria bacterium P01_H01_bin.15]
MTNLQRIAVIGLGAMGSRIAQNLLNSGNYAVVVNNRSPEKARRLIEQGAIWATTPRAASEQSDVVISMVTNNEASQDVWLMPERGALWGLTPPKVAIVMSTLTVDRVQELNSSIIQQGAKFLEVPVLGSRPQAEARKLIGLAGGTRAVVTQINSVLTDAGLMTIHHLGSVGQGMACKLAVNALFGIQVAAIAELLGMLTHVGISPTQAMSCFSDLPVLSLAAKGAGNLIAAQNHAPLFPINLVSKDFLYATQLAQSLEASLPISNAVLAGYQSAIAQGYGDQNITSIAQLFL